MKFRWCLILALLLSVQAEATTVQRLSMDDLVSKSRSIVVGTVRTARTHWSNDGRLILTSYDIDVQETLKGPRSRSVTISVLGGTIGNLTLHVAGMPAFEVDERAVVFIENTGAYSTVLGLGQGKFSISNGEVFNHVSDLEFTDGRRGSRLRMPFDEFRDEIRRRVNRLF